MFRKLRFATGVVAGLLVLCGCSEITSPKLLTSFDWGEVQDPETVVEGIGTSVAFGDLFILGQMNTPTRCYRLEADFNQNGSNLTVRVNADPTNAPNCDDSLGGFRYTATMSNLKFGTYQLRVVHDITAGTGGEYTKTVTIK